MEGFTGRSSLLYHLTPPTRTHKIEPVSKIRLEAADDGLHRHRLTKTGAIGPKGDVVTGRVPLYFNSDVVFGVVRPARVDAGWNLLPQRHRRRDAVRPRGNRGLRHDLRTARATARATTSSCPSARPGGSTRTRVRSSGCSTSRRRRSSSRPSATATTTASCSSTRRIRSATFTPRTRPAPRDEEGDFVIHVRSSDRITAYHYRHHPFDVVGWDGYLWPFRFNIGDFQPITGRVHQPPPVHQTFEARNFVVCSFVPRKFDYHPLAIPAPYNHSNINSDEVIYYVAGNFMSRRGVEIASFTLHPAGIPHGPHPGTVEASIGKEATEELAVMVDTFHPLHVTQAAMDLDDDRYPYSWLPPEDASGEAAELSERGPEAFPDSTARGPGAAASAPGASAEPAHRPGPPGPWCGCRRCVGGRRCRQCRGPALAHHLVALTALVVVTSAWVAGVASAATPLRHPAPTAC